MVNGLMIWGLMVKRLIVRVWNYHSVRVRYRIVLPAGNIPGRWRSLYVVDMVTLGGILGYCG